MQIVIPLSGIGSRFINAGYQTPKPLIKVDGIPMIQHVVNLFPNENNFIFICNELHLQKNNMFNILKNIKPGCQIFSVSNDNRQGPVHAINMVSDYISDKDEIIVSYCDYGTDWNYSNFLKDSRERNSDGSIACYKGFHPHMLGTDNYAFLKETQKDSRFMEKIQEKKPFTENRMQEYASNGTYYFKNGKIMKYYFQKLIDLGIKINNEYYVSMVYNLLVEDNLKVNIYEINHMLQWGTPYDLECYEQWSNYFRKIIIPQKYFKDKLNITTIIPLAGKGSRFTQIGYKLPKPLIEINYKPMIIQATDCLPKSKDYIFICLQEHINNYVLDEKIKQYYPNSNIYTLNHVTQGQACTTEYGIKQDALSLEKPILISACDNSVYYNHNKYQKLLNNTNIDIIVWSFRNHPTSKLNPEMYAWLEVDNNDFITNVSCKKYESQKHDLKNSHVIIGTMFFRKGKYFMDGLYNNYTEDIKTNNEYYVDDIINQNIKAGLKVKVFEVEHYICWGTPNDYDTYIYWQNFFNKCNWHPYRIENDITC